MLTVLTIILGIGALVLTVLGAYKRSPRLSWLGGLCLTGYLTGMLLLDRPWEEMLASALLLLCISACRRQEAYHEL